MKKEFRRARKQPKLSLKLKKSSVEDLQPSKEGSKNQSISESTKESPPRNVRATLDSLLPFKGQMIRIDPRKVCDPPESMSSSRRKREYVGRLKDFFLATSNLHPQKSFILAMEHVSIYFILLSFSISKELPY